MRKPSYSFFALALLGASACGSKSEPLELAAQLAKDDARLARILGAARRPLQPGPDGSRRAPTSGGLEVLFPARADAPLTLRRGSEFIRLSALGTTSQPSIEASGRVVVTRAQEDVDYVIAPSCDGDPEGDCGVNGVEWALLLGSAPSIASFKWRLELSPVIAGSEVEADGAIAFLSSDRSVAFRVLRPYAIDAAGKRRDAELTLAGDQLTVTLRTDGLRFPVLLDPAIEAGAWQALFGGPPPGGEGVFDEVRRQVVVFAGSNGGTWSWNGSWSRLQTAFSPPQPADFAMTYDSARDRAVVFGGGQTNETWEWDGAGWNRAVPATSPSARTGTAMAFDAARGRTVLFGGSLVPGTSSDETWLWDGSNWVSVFPVVKPPPRFGHLMAYDAQRARVVLQGGWAPNPSGPGLTLSADTWEWDGINWAKVGATPEPLGGNGVLVFDSGRGLVLLIGGEDRTGAARSETLGWDGQSWRVIQTNQAPPRAGHAGAYDPVRDVTVIANGRSFAETWELQGNVWTPVPLMPPVRSGHASAYDPVNRGVLVFGGTTNPPSTFNPLGDTWLWNGGSWSELTPVAPPSPRSDVFAATDFARQRVVLFGGRTVSASVDETWEWDGNAWHRRFPTVSPPPAAGRSMAWDPIRRRVLLLSEGTWEWDGTNWSLLAPLNPPPFAEASAMAWSASSSALVMFGSTYSRFAETWLWNGIDWTQQANATGVRPLSNGQFAMASSSKGAVMFGGHNDYRTWEWLDGGWIDRTTQEPPSRRSHTMVQDPLRRRIVMYGGFVGVSGPITSEVWEFRLRGGTCQSAADCDTGWCVDGVCCDARCGDGNPFDCQACSRATGAEADGVCGPIRCAAAGPCEAPGTCDPSNGQCSAPVAKPNGTSCDDGNDCTTGDSCTAGACVGVNAPDDTFCRFNDCFVYHRCTSGSCLPFALPRPAGSPCDDGNTCTVTDACTDAGTCIGSIAPNGTPCESGLACSRDDTCRSGACTAGPDDCPAAACATSSCAPHLRRCLYSPLPDGTACDDSSGCTPGGSCSAGLCGPVAPDLTACDGGLCFAGECVPPLDAGIPDSGTSHDAGADGGQVDSGVSSDDAGVSPGVDAGLDEAPPLRGCGCSTNVEPLLLALGLLALKRKRGPARQAEGASRLPQTGLMRR